MGRAYQLIGPALNHGFLGRDFLFPHRFLSAAVDYSLN
jgi:hypothetical protein